MILPNPELAFRRLSRTSTAAWTSNRSCVSVSARARFASAAVKPIPTIWKTAFSSGYLACFGDVRVAAVKYCGGGNGVPTSCWLDDGEMGENAEDEKDTGE